MKYKKILTIIIAVLAIMAIAAMPVIVRERISIMTREDVWLYDGADVLLSSGALSGGNFDTSSQTIGLYGNDGRVAVAAPTSLASATPVFHVNSDGLGQLMRIEDAATPVFQISDGGAVAVAGALTFEGKLTVNDAIEANGDSDEHQLVVEAHSTQTSDVVRIRQSNATNVVAIDNSGNTTITGTLGIQGAATVYDQVTIDGDGDEHQLVVEAHSTQTSDLVRFRQSDSTNVFAVSNAGNMTISGTLQVEGDIHDGAGDIVVDDAARVSGALTANTLAVTSTVNVDGAVTLNSTLDIGGNISSDTGAISTTDDITVTGKISVTDTSDLQGNVYDNEGTFTIADDTLIDGQADAEQLVVQGHSSQTAQTLVVEQSDSTRVATIDNSGNAAISGTLQVEGDIFDNAGDVVVDDAARVSGTLTQNASSITTTLTIGTWEAFTGQTELTIAMNDTITPTGTYQPLTAGGAVSAGGIAAGTAGQLLILTNISANNITITDTGTVMLNANRVLGQYDTIMLLSDGTNWLELSYNDN